MKKRKKKAPIVHKVYKITIIATGEFYYGKSKKTGKAWDKYYGSGATKNMDHKLLTKELLHSYTGDRSASHAAYCEFLYQQENIWNDKCLNQMLHFRINSNSLRDFKR